MLKYLLAFFFSSSKENIGYRRLRRKGRTHTQHTKREKYIYRYIILTIIIYIFTKKYIYNNNNTNSNNNNNNNNKNILFLLFFNQYIKDTYTCVSRIANTHKKEDRRIKEEVLEVVFFPLF